MDVVEPYLLQLGFLDRTPRAGWPPAAYDHLGEFYPERAEQAEQPGLFEPGGVDELTTKYTKDTK